jgi:hypothetical protein
VACHYTLRRTTGTRGAASATGRTDDRRCHHGRRRHDGGPAGDDAACVNHLMSANDGARFRRAKGDEARFLISRSKPFFQNEKISRSRVFHRQNTLGLG